jgi:hypothetical protein
MLNSRIKSTGLDRSHILTDLSLEGNSLTMNLFLKTPMNRPYGDIQPKLASQPIGRALKHIGQTTVGDPQRLSLSLNDWNPMREMSNRREVVRSWTLLEGKLKTPARKHSILFIIAANIRLGLRVIIERYKYYVHIQGLMLYRYGNYGYNCCKQ